MIAFVHPYIYSPDLVERLKNNWPLQTPDHSTFYGGNHVAYTGSDVHEK